MSIYRDASHGKGYAKQRLECTEYPDDKRLKIVWEFYAGFPRIYWCVEKHDDKTRSPKIALNSSDIYIYIYIIYIVSDHLQHTEDYVTVPGTAHTNLRNPTPRIPR